MIADATEAIRLKPNVAIYNLRGSAYYDKGEYDIAIADFNDALRMGPPSGIIFHNRGNAWRAKGDYARAIADYDTAIKAGPKSAFSYQSRHLQAGARRSRRRAGRYQRGDPHRPVAAAAPDQPRGDLARQGRRRPRDRRHHGGDPAGESERARQHHDAAGQRADLGLPPARPRP
ncbi:tetratricopeptide repeat protein [Bradyrhizobium sp. ISRA463]|uniref:tetratricopeptide repeat protein n=1 Tax=unclassified Bradyrhizobium TaxID=2631580 RepID=UPI0032B06FA8